MPSLLKLIPMPFWRSLTKWISSGFRANNDYGFGVPQDFWIKKGSQQVIHIKLKQGKLDMFNQQHVKTKDGQSDVLLRRSHTVDCNGTLRRAAIADESKIDGKQRDVDGVRFDMGSERYRFELNKIKT